MGKKSDAIRSAVVTLKELTADEKIQLQCEARERYEMEQAAIIQCGEARGEARGEAKGELFKVIELVRKKYSRNLPVDVIAEHVEEDIELVKRICSLLAQNSEMSAAEISEKL